MSHSLTLRKEKKKLWKFWRESNPLTFVFPRFEFFSAPIAPWTVYLFIYRKTARFQNSLVSESATRATPKHDRIRLTECVKFYAGFPEEALNICKLEVNPHSVKLLKYGRLEDTRVCRVGVEYREYSAVEEAKGQE